MASKTSKTSSTGTGSKVPTAEQREQVLALHASGEKFGNVVAATGLAAAAVDRIIDTDRAAQRLAALEVDGVRESCQFWLGQPVLEYLHDAPYRALAELTRDADLNYGEWKPVSDAALAARSDDAAVQAVTDVREAMAERIAQIAAGTWKRPVAAATPKSAVDKVVASMAQLSDEEIAALKEALAAR